MLMDNRDQSSLQAKTVAFSSSSDSVESSNHRLFASNSRNENHLRISLGWTRGKVAVGAEEGSGAT